LCEGGCGCVEEGVVDNERYGCIKDRRELSRIRFENNSKLLHGFDLQKHKQGADKFLNNK